MRAAWAEINLNNILHNLNEIKKILNPKTKIMAIIKANAYGHGSLALSKIIEKKIESFGVAILDEAITLRKNGIKKPILILGYTDKLDYPWLIKKNIIQTIFTKEQAVCLNKTAAEMNKFVTIHLKIDTGMNRIGFSDTNTSLNIINDFKKLSFLKIKGIFSHIANGGCKNLNYSKIQIERFKNFSSKVENLLGKKLIKHLANSSTLIEFPESHFQMVRPGILLYGSFSTNNKNKNKLKLKKALTLKSKIVKINLLKINDQVSYKGTFIAKKNMTIATIPIGYADGIFRSLSNKSYFLLKGKNVKIIGNICMDQLMIDITNIKNVKIGDEVIIYGEKNPIEKFSKILKTIPYELFCAINDRIPKIYL